MTEDNPDCLFLSWTSLFYSKNKSNFELRFTMCDFKYEYKGLDLSPESTLEDQTAQATGGTKRGNV